MHSHDLTYFENSRRATYVHQQHAIRILMALMGMESMLGDYGQRRADSRHRTDREGWTYILWLSGAVYPVPDDGTLSPWTTITALPFAPEISANH